MASLNRLILDAAAGLPARWRGKRAFDLLGREPLSKRIDAMLEVPAGTNPIDHLNVLLATTDDRRARAIATDWGAALGFLLNTLRNGDEPDRLARPEWDASYWDHWRSIDRVHVGGGLVAGSFGDVALEATRNIVGDTVRVEMPAHPGLRPLIGLAGRSEEPLPTVVLDLGSTLIKRALVSGTNECVRLRPLQLIPVRIAAPPEDLAEQIIDAAVGTLGPALSDSEHGDITLSVSIANYVVANRFASDDGYGRLGQLWDDPATSLALDIQERIGKRVQILLTHDGTAAAMAWASQHGVAVILAGTALGVGFPNTNVLPARPVQVDAAETSTA